MVYWHAAPYAIHASAIVSIAYAETYGSRDYDPGCSGVRRYFHIGGPQNVVNSNKRSPT